MSTPRFAERQTRFAAALGAARTIVLVAVYGTLTFVSALAAQAPHTEEAGESHDGAALRVHLACVPCAGADFAREITYVAWVPDSGAADVRVLASPAPARSGADRYLLYFVGEGRFDGRADTLELVVDATATQRVRHDRLIQLIQLGLVRYLADTPLAGDLRISVVSASNGAPPPSAPPRQPTPQPERPAAAAARWAAAVDLGFTGSSGNSDLVALTTGARVRHRQTSRFRFDWSSSLRYGESGGEVVARHVQSKLDFDLGADARVAPFISAAAERDPFRKLDLRSKAGTGMRFGFYKAERGQASMRLAVLYSHERFSPDADRLPRSDGAWSLTLNGSHRLGESVRVENSSSFDPVIGELSDYNLDVKSTLSTKITSHLALTLGHTYTYDSTPATEVRHADQRVQAGLTIEF